MRIGLILLLVTSIIFGQRVADPYRWLEDASSAKTQAWIAQQNARAARVIDAYAGNAHIAKRVRQLAVTGPQRFSPQLAGNTLFFMREVPPQPQPELVACAWPSGAVHIVVNPARYGPAVSIDEVWPSPTGKLVAIGTASGGSEATTIRVVAANGRGNFTEALGPAGGGTTAPALAWDANERGFTYARLPANGSQFGIKLYHHVLGTPQSKDTLVLGAISPIAEYTLLTGAGARRAAALVQFGDGSPQRVYVRRGARWRAVIGPQAGIVSGAYAHGDLLLVATGGTPRGRIALLQHDGSLKTLVPQETNWAMHTLAPVRGGFLVVKSWGTLWRVDQYRSDGTFVRTVPLPSAGIGIGDIASDDSQPQALIDYSGWTIPPRWANYDARSGTLRTIYALKPASRAYADVQARLLYATSRDGTKVPFTVLSLGFAPRDGSAPAILTGYGGFDIPTAPHFIGPMLSWLEMGGIYAVANPRGGSEYGEAWHQAGMLEQKQHVFDDFYAVAQTLVKDRYTSPSRLGIEGGSNGGLLVGAALIQHPSMYRAVVGDAGIYDTLRHHLFPNGAYNVTEYGSPSNRAQFAALYAYSPYHHVRRGAAYPATLLITSENDPRVAPWQSWKFGAALEAATSSKRPIIVLTRRTGGHGHGASFAQQVGNEAVMLSFMAAQLGIKPDFNAHP